MPREIVYEAVAQVERQTHEEASSICANAQQCSSRCKEIVDRLRKGQTYQVCKKNNKPAIPGMTICQYKGPFLTRVKVNKYPHVDSEK